MHQFNHRDGELLSIGDTTLYVEQQGNMQGPTLLFLHGGFGTMADYNPLLSALPGGYRLVGIDSRGHGRSTQGAQPMSYARLQQDVETVVSHLGLDKITIFGHSDGGIVALRMAAEKRVDVQKIIALGAHWDLPTEDPVREIFKSITAESWSKMFPESVALYQQLNPAADFPAFTRQIVQMWLDDSAEGYPKESVRNISSELLIVRGDEDQLVSRSNAWQLAERVPQARLFNVPFVDHDICGEPLALLLPIITRFLQG